jgi:hypothetical protein
MSKIWAHVGTLLAYVGAVGGDAGAWHLPSDVALAINVIAGVLAAAHLAVSSPGKVLEWVGRGVSGLAHEAALSYRAALDANKAPTDQSRVPGQSAVPAP